MDEEERYYIQEGDRVVANNVDLDVEEHGEFGLSFIPAEDGTFLENAEFLYYDRGDTEELYQIHYDEDFNPYVNKLKD